MSNPFSIIMLEGIFYAEDDLLYVQRDDGTKQDVFSELESLKDRPVRFAATHVPPHGKITDEWGGGSCYWKPSGWCPAGHHENPSKVLVWTGDGLLSRENEKWFISSFDGSKNEIPLALLAGHYSRITAAPTDAVERMRDVLSSQMGAAEQVESLTSQANDLKDLLNRIKNTKL